MRLTIDEGWLDFVTRALFGPDPREHLRAAYERYRRNYKSHPRRLFPSDPVPWAVRMLRRWLRDRDGFIVPLCLEEYAALQVFFEGVFADDDGRVEGNATGGRNGVAESDRRAGGDGGPDEREGGAPGGGAVAVRPGPPASGGGE